MSAMSSAGISKTVEYVRSKIKQNDFIYVRGTVDVPLGEMEAEMGRDGLPS